MSHGAGKKSRVIARARVKRCQTRLQCDNKTFGDDFDDLMFVFLILLLTSTRLQCDNKTFGDDFDALMLVFFVLLLMSASFELA